MRAGGSPHTQATELDHSLSALISDGATIVLVHGVQSIVVGGIYNS